MFTNLTLEFDSCRQYKASTTFSIDKVSGYGYTVDSAVTDLLGNIKNHLIELKEVYKTSENPFLFRQIESMELFLKNNT